MPKCCFADFLQTTEYFAYYMLTNYAANAEIKGFVDKYDYYLFPVVNPDGKFFVPSVKKEC